MSKFEIVINLIFHSNICRIAWKTSIKKIDFIITYKIIILGKEFDDIIEKSFKALRYLRFIGNKYSDIYCSDADYLERPYYDIIEIKQ